MAPIAARASLPGPIIAVDIIIFCRSGGNEFHLAKDRNLAQFFAIGHLDSQI